MSRAWAVNHALEGKAAALMGEGHKSEATAFTVMHAQGLSKIGCTDLDLKIRTIPEHQLADVYRVSVTGRNCYNANVPIARHTCAAALPYYRARISSQGFPAGDPAGTGHCDSPSVSQQATTASACSHIVLMLLLITVTTRLITDNDLAPGKLTSWEHSSPFCCCQSRCCFDTSYTGHSPAPAPCGLLWYRSLIGLLSLI